MKIIDAKNATAGRLASYAAKEALRGEDIVVVNSEQAIITGNREDIRRKFLERKGKIGSGQKGPKHSKNSEMMLKRMIRGMLPNYREGRGKVAYHKIKCYVGVPKEFENSKKVVAGKEKKGKYITISEVSE